MLTSRPMHGKAERHGGKNVVEQSKSFHGGQEAERLTGDGDKCASKGTLPVIYLYYLVPTSQMSTTSK
jgi:hypothetical protein